MKKVVITFIVIAGLIGFLILLYRLYFPYTPDWEKLGIEFNSFICTEEYAQKNGFLAKDIRNKSPYYLIYIIADKKDPSIYAQLKFHHPAFKNEIIEFSVKPGIHSTPMVLHKPLQLVRKNKIDFDDKKNIDLRAYRIELK